ncbi:MAG: V-type ATPase subunit [Clostridiales bacterium]|nr:V-type ATPase subunit [Clostridiales bacterium]
MNVDYSALSAKLKAMHAKFLTPEDYEQLMGKKTVNDVCSYMKNTPGYGDILSDINAADIHRGQMEILVKGSVVNDYTRLYSFADSSKRYILKYWFMHHEIEFLIREIQYIYTHEERDTGEINDEIFERFFKTHTGIDREGMYSAKNLDDCANACKNTPYYEPLRRAQSLDVEFFSISMILESFYYNAFWRDINTKVPKDQRELFRLLVGSKIDALNLMWIYRGKKFFNFPEELIYTYLIPVRHRISEEEIKNLVKSESAEIFLARVRETKYAKLFSGVETGTYPELNYRRMIRKNAKRVFVSHSQSLAAVYAFLYLKEFEVLNIKTIIECVRYGVEPEEIRRRLDI